MTETGHDHVEPARRRAGRRHGRPAAARRRGAHRRRRRAAPCAPATRSAACRCAGRTCSRATGACRTRRARSSPPTAASGTGDVGQWVATARRGLPAPRRPREGPHHHRRAQRVSRRRSRSASMQLPGVEESAVDRRARSRFRRSGGGGDRRQAGPHADRSGGHRRARRARSRTSRCPSAWCSRTSFRATRWARCRRRCCARSSQRPDAFQPALRRRVAAAFTAAACRLAGPRLTADLRACRANAVCDAAAVGSFFSAVRVARERAADGFAAALARLARGLLRPGLRRQRDTRLARLRQPDRDGLLGRACAMLAFANVMDFLADELARLGRRRLALLLVAPCSRDGVLVRHGR